MLCMWYCISATTVYIYLFQNTEVDKTDMYRIITLIIIYLFNTKRVKKNHHLLILNAGPGKNKLKHAEALRLSSALCE